MIKIAICDDSEYIRKKNEELLVKYTIQKDIDCKIKQFENGEGLLNEVDDFDLIFLDYQFEDKGADGMVIAKAIRKKNADITIIFLSSYTNVVFETFEVGTFRFLTKPLEEEKLYGAMDAYMESLKNEKTICVKSGGANHFIKENQISYIEGNGKYCIIHLINKKKAIECIETLAAVEDRINSKSFFRCHKSFLINMKYVDSYTHNELLLQDDEMVAISRQRYKLFKNAYAEYLLEA